LSPTAPFKRKPPPIGRSPPRAVRLIRQRPSVALSSPTAQAFASPAPTTEAPPRRTPSERHRHLPPFGEHPSELLCSSIDRRLLTPWSPSSYRTPPHSSTTTGATPPPLNTAARRLLRRLTVGPPLWCAPAPSSLPDTPPVAPSISLTEPCRRLAATTPSHARTVHARYRAAGRLLGWTGPPGRSPAGLSASRAWQAATLRGL
jgi:hypothetical protein